MEEKNKNKLYTIWVDLEKNDKNPKNSLENQLGCEVLNIKEIGLNSPLIKPNVNRYIALIFLNKPIHGNTQNFREYFENKLEGNNLVAYFEGVQR